jgi:hypothetical protein
MRKKLMSFLIYFFFLFCDYSKNGINHWLMSIKTPKISVSLT